MKLFLLTAILFLGNHICYSQSPHLVIPFKKKLSGNFQTFISPDKETFFRYTNSYDLNEPHTTDYIDAFSGDLLYSFDGFLLNPSPDGKRCALAKSKKEVIIYDLKTSKKLAHLKLFEKLENFSITQFYFSPENGYAFFSGNLYLPEKKDFELKYYVWNYLLDELKEVTLIPENTRTIGYLSKNEIVYETEEHVCVLNLATAKTKEIFKLRSSCLIEIHPNSALVLVKEIGGEDIRNYVLEVGDSVKVLVNVRKVYDVSKDGKLAIIQSNDGSLELLDVRSGQTSLLEVNINNYSIDNLYFYRGETQKILSVEGFEENEKILKFQPLKNFKKHRITDPNTKLTSTLSEWRKDYVNKATLLFTDIDRFILANYDSKKFYVFQLSEQKIIDSVSFSNDFESIWMTPLDSSRVLVKLGSAGISKTRRLSDWLKIFDLQTMQFVDTPNWNQEEDYGDWQNIQFLPSTGRIFCVEEVFQKRDEYLENPELLKTDGDIKFLGRNVREIDFLSGETIAITPLEPRAISDYFFSKNADFLWVNYYKETQSALDEDTYWYNLKEIKPLGIFSMYCNNLQPLTDDFVLMNLGDKSLVFHPQKNKTVKLYESLNLSQSLVHQNRTLIAESQANMWDLGGFPNVVEYRHVDHLDVPVFSYKIDGELLSKSIDTSQNSIHVLVLKKDTASNFYYQWEVIPLHNIQGQSKVHSVLLKEKKNVLEPKVLRSDNPYELTIKYDDFSWKVIDLKTGRPKKSVRVPSPAGQTLETFLSADQQTFTVISTLFVSSDTTFAATQHLGMQKWDVSSNTLLSSDTIFLKEDHQFFRFQNIGLDSFGNLYWEEGGQGFWIYYSKKKRIEKLTNVPSNFSSTFIKNAFGEPLAFYYSTELIKYKLFLFGRGNIKKLDEDYFAVLSYNNSNLYWWENNSVSGSYDIKKYNSNSDEISILKDLRMVSISDDETYVSRWDYTATGAYGYGIINRNKSEIVQKKDSVKVPNGMAFSQRVYDTAFKVLEQADSSYVTDFAPDLTTFTKGNDFFVVTTKENPQVGIYSTDSGEKLAEMYAIDHEDFLTLTPDEYYSGTLQAVTSLNIESKNQSIHASTFDWWRNRPDIIVERLNPSDSAAIQTLTKAWKKRLSRAELSPQEPDYYNDLPECVIKNKEEIGNFSVQPKVNLEIELATKKGTLKSYFVHVNGTLVVRNDISSKSTAALTVTETIFLSSGINNISVFCVDDSGRVSSKLSLTVFYEGETEQETLYYVGLGVSEFIDSTYNLVYAEKDIRDLAAMFKIRYPNSSKIHTFTNEQVTTQSLKEVQKLLLDAKENDKIVISFSGHGMIDDKQDLFLSTYNTDFTKPGNGSIAYDSLVSFLGEIKSRNKLLLIDACHSGEIDKKGKLSKAQHVTSEVKKYIRGSSVVKKSSQQSIFNVMQNVFSDLNTGNGTTIISASGGEEFAFENEIWKNGVFTYSVIKGLQDFEADFDKNGEITVSELQKFVGNKVLSLTNGMQKPTSRQYNYEANFKIW